MVLEFDPIVTVRNPVLVCFWTLAQYGADPVSLTLWFPDPSTVRPVNDPDHVVLLSTSASGVPNAEQPEHRSVSTKARMSLSTAAYFTQSHCHPKPTVDPQSDPLAVGRGAKVLDAYGRNLREFIHVGPPKSTDFRLP